MCRLGQSKIAKFFLQTSKLVNSFSFCNAERQSKPCFYYDSSLFDFVSNHPSRIYVFKNVTAYRIGAHWNASLAEIESALASNRFIECSPGQDKSVGWIEPRGIAHGPLLENIGGQWIVKLMIETKSVPSSVVKRKADLEVQEIESKTGRKPGKKEKREMCEDILHSLMPQAFAKQGAVTVWINPKDRLLAIDAASTGKADEVITQLVRALPSLDLNLLQTATSPQTAMAAWLLAVNSDEIPASLNVEKECVLKSGAEDQPMVRYTRHILSTEEVRKHVREGKLPTQLALSWEGKASFVLTDNLQFKKLSFLDGTEPDSINTQGEDKFDANVVLSTGMLGPLIKDILEALGGENVFAEQATEAEGPPF
jgi:recombination associated protein RdgC